MLTKVITLSLAGLGRLKLIQLTLEGITAWIAVTLSFNTLGLDSSNNNNVIDTELELLKASKFKIRLKHPLTADDPEDDKSSPVSQNTDKR